MKGKEKKKDYCECLVGAKPEKKLKYFLLGSQRSTMYYEARHRSKNIHLMWMESPRWGEVRCYPCVLETDEGTLVYQSSALDECRDNNYRLAETVSANFNRENIVTDFLVTQLEAKAFNEEFRRYRKEDLERAIAEAERENGITHGEEKAEEEAPALPENEEK